MTSHVKMKIFTQMKILRVSCKVSSVGNFVDGFGGDTHIDNDDSIHLELGSSQRINECSVHKLDFDMFFNDWGLLFYVFIYFPSLSFTRFKDLN